jgi:hypothetical protein
MGRRLTVSVMVLARQPGRVATGARCVRREAVMAINLLWVCIDCYYAHHGIADEIDNTPDCEPLSLVDPADDLTSGMLAEHHGCGRERGEEIDECECETDSFSRSSCDGCGSHLAGTRHALTLWELAA